MIRFVCECGKELQAREENAGRAVICPACQRQQQVPQLSAEAIQPEEPIELSPTETGVQTRRPAIRQEDEFDEEEDRPRRAAATGSSGKAVASLILGIFSLFCNVLTGVPALIAGLLALRDINRSRGRVSGQGLAIAGIVSAGVGTLLSCVLLLPALLLPAVQKVREAAGRAQSSNNLKQMGIAMLNYNDTYQGRMPPPAFGDPNKPEGQRRPLLSWRVAILPYVEQQFLYNQFKLDEPWDSPNNKPLLAKMPKIYQLPGDDKTPPDHTHYQVFVGNGAAFESSRSVLFPGEFADGSSNTILIATIEQAVPWTKPDDVPFDPNRPIAPLLSTFFRSGTPVVMADGSVRFVKRDISEKTLKAAITRNGNEPLGSDW